MNHGDSVLYQAFAKINLGLWVGPGVSAGYHPVDTVLQTVTLADDLIVGPADRMVWRTSDATLQWNDGNLVFEAYRWLKAQWPAMPALALSLTKRIPVGAGLGGGSADAAALIRWARDQVSDAISFRTAGTLGKDVPFLIHGGTARAQGYGDVVHPLPPLSGAAVLMNPGVAVATKAVYRRFDQVSPRGAISSDWMDDIAQSVAEGVLPKDLVNLLEPALFSVVPAVRDFAEWIRSLIRPERCYLSGSGPTYYSLGPDLEWATWLSHKLHQEGVPWVAPVAFQGPVG